MTRGGLAGKKGPRRIEGWGAHPEGTVTVRAAGTLAMTAGHCHKQRGSGGAVSPLAGSGQSPGRGPGGEAPGSSGDFAISEALKWLRILTETLFEYGYTNRKTQSR